MVELNAASQLHNAKQQKSKPFFHNAIRFSERNLTIRLLSGLVLVSTF